MIKYVTFCLIMAVTSVQASEWGDLEASSYVDDTFKLCIIEKYAPEPNFSSLGIEKPDCSAVNLRGKFRIEYNNAHSESFNDEAQALNIDFFFRKNFYPFIVNLPKEKTPYIAAVVSHWKVGLPAADKNKSLAMVGNTNRPIEFTYHFEPLEEDDILYNHNLPRNIAQMEMIVDEYNVIEERALFGTTVIATYKRENGFGYAQQKKYRTTKANEETKSISLLGITLLDATQKGMQMKLTKAGLSKLSSENGIDTYDSSSVTKGTRILSVGFTSSGKFATATYDFPMNEGQLTEKFVLNKLSKKYGNFAYIGTTMKDSKAGWLFGWLQIYVDKDETKKLVQLHYINRANYYQFKKETEGQVKQSDNFAF